MTTAGHALTPDEREALRMTADLCHLVWRIMADSSDTAGQPLSGTACQQDYGEFVADIHRIQHRIMAQAAARAYPVEFRLLGHTLEQSTG